MAYSKSIVKSTKSQGNEKEMASVSIIHNVIDTVSAYTLENGDFVAISGEETTHYGTVTEMVDEGMRFLITLDNDDTPFLLRWDAKVSLLEMPA